MSYMNTPVGIPSGWEEIAAYWSKDYEWEMMDESFGQGNKAEFYNDPYLDHDWRIVE